VLSSIYKQGGKLRHIIDNVEEVLIRDSVGHSVGHLVADSVADSVANSVADSIGH
jgi:hypothetical protein